MKDYDFDFTNTNIEKSLERDTLKRNVKLNKLIELLNNINVNKIISIDGKWGCGKTVFLKQLEYINKNELYNDNDHCYNNMNINNIKNFIAKYDVFYYNAWENEMHETPVLSLIYNLINKSTNFKNKIVSASINFEEILKEHLKTLNKGIINIDGIKTYNELVKDIYSVEKQKNALNKILELITEDNKKIIYIIDELYRCEPSYALKMIETLTHFYSNQNIIFLLGVNNEQLSCSISNYYGSGFNGYEYLNKIYNLIIALDEIDQMTYLETVLNIPNNSSWYSASLYAVCKYFDFQMREINRFINDCDIIAEYIKTSDYKENNKIVSNIFLPYCLGLKIKSKKELNDFINGKGYNNLEMFVIDNIKLKKIITYTIKIEKNIEINDQTEEDIKNYLREVYSAYFYNYDDNWETKEIRKEFIDIISLISPILKYD